MVDPALQLLIAEEKLGNLFGSIEHVRLFLLRLYHFGSSVIESPALTAVWELRQITSDRYAAS